MLLFQSRLIPSGKLKKSGLWTEEADLHNSATGGIKRDWVYEFTDPEKKLENWDHLSRYWGDVIRNLPKSDCFSDEVLFSSGVPRDAEDGGRVQH